MSLLESERGIGAIGMIIGVLIIAALTVLYMRESGTVGGGSAVTEEEGRSMATGARELTGSVNAREADKSRAMQGIAE